MVIFSFHLISIFISWRAFAAPHLFIYSIIYLCQYGLMSHILLPLLSFLLFSVSLCSPSLSAPHCFLYLSFSYDLFLLKKRLFVPWSFPPLALAEHVPTVSVITPFHPLGLLWTSGSPRGLIRCWLDIFGKTTSYIAVCLSVWRYRRSGCLPFCDIEIDPWVWELLAWLIHCQVPHQLFICWVLCPLVIIACVH